MIERIATASCIAAAVAGLASAVRLADIGLGSVELGFDASFEYLMITCAVLQGIASILLVVFRRFATLIPFVVVSAVPMSLEIFPPVPIRSLWEVISTLAFSLGVLALVAIAVRNLTRKRRRLIEE